MNVLHFFSFIKAPLKQCLSCLPKCLFIPQLFPLFLRSIVLLWCSKVHRLTLILPTKYLCLSSLWSYYADSVTLRKKWIFMDLYIIRNIGNTKNIKVIKGLAALKVLNFQSSGFLKALRYTESPNHLPNHLVVEHDAKALSTLLLDFLILMCSFLPRVIRISR